MTAPASPDVAEVGHLAIGYVIEPLDALSWACPSLATILTSLHFDSWVLCKNMFRSSNG